MTYKQFLDLATQYHQQYPEMRKGQAFMNCLYQVNPYLHDLISTNEFDCFYDNSRYWNFLQIVEKNITDQVENKRFNLPKVIKLY